MSLSKEELVITALKERIGQLSENYELQIAVLRAELTTLINLNQEKNLAEKQYSDSLNHTAGEQNG